MRYSLIALVLKLKSREFAFFQLAFIRLASALTRDLLNLPRDRERFLARLRRGIDVGNARRCRSIHRGAMEIGANGHENSAMGFYLSCGIIVSQSTATGQELLRRPIQLSPPLVEKFIPACTHSHTYTSSIVPSSSSHVILDFSL